MDTLTSSPIKKMLSHSVEEPTISLSGKNCNNTYDLETRNDFMQFLILKNVISQNTDSKLPILTTTEIIWKTDHANNVDINLDQIQYLLDRRRDPLEEIELNQVNNLLDSPLHEREFHTIVTNKFNIDMTKSKLKCLVPVTWLNDEVINFYMCMLQERDNIQTELSCGTRKPSHYFNSFFMERMFVKGQYNYDNIKRWTKKFNIFLLDKVFIPVNINNTHWTMIVVYIQLKRIHYYDSMNGPGIDRYLKHVFRWLKDESKEKYRNRYAVEDIQWQLIEQEDNVPQQENGWDCGVFSILAADFLSDNIPLEDSYSQSEVYELEYRKRICAAILRGKLLY